MDVASLFRCPKCRGSELVLQSKQMICANSECGHSCPGRHGYFDFMTGLNRRVASTPEQRLMESELVARVYERMWRPNFVRLMAGKGAEAITGFAGEFFIHKNSLNMDEREGPWLDLSCGPGTFSRAMASASPGSWVVGLDIARSMVEVAASKGRGYDNLIFVRGDAHELPIADGCMSGVNNSGALHVYDDPEAVFSEVWRVLKSDGLFVGSTYSPAKSFVGRTLSQVAGIRRFRPAELRAWLSRIGFADYEELRLGQSFVFRVRKP